MPKQYWLVKQEPTKYPWSQLVKDKKTYWDGVRNYQARNNLKEMKKGDLVLYYHSIVGTEVVGICEVVREFYQDPTIDDDRWVVVDLAAKRALKRPVTLAEIKEDKALSEMALIKQSRLSVMPVAKPEFDRILKLGSKAG
ncbi:MAG: EVE domain-containing protein [Candidatus Binatia bacterium]|nr:EVE domain-containing protein [Candidatus Binatia bacterium]